MRKRFKYPLTIIGLLICIFSVLGICYLFYDKFVYDAIVLVDESLSINFIKGNKFDNKHNKELKFTVINNGEEDINYYIYLNEITGKTSYRLVSSEANLDIDAQLSSGVISSYINIKPKEIQNYTMTFSSDGEYSGKINVNKEAQNQTLFNEVLLKNNNVSENPKTNLGATTNEDEGLIEIGDNGMDGYYYRGNVTNNYVSFANYTWRILKINKDGSVRLVLNDNLDDLYAYNESTDSYRYSSSDIKSVLDNFYETNLKEYSNYIATSNYCNDLPSEDLNSIYNRVMIDKIISLNCLSETITTTIGLLSIDEVIASGASIEGESSNYFLNNSSIENDYYTMSSAKVIDTSYYPFVIKKDGTISTDTKSTTKLGVRPVINIIKNVAINGTGSINDPYTIVPIESE